MTLTWLWLRLEFGRRWRSLVVLGLLVALSVGVVATALAGARRGDTAIQRLAQRTRPATADLVNYTPGVDWDAVREFPEVESLSTFVGALGIALVGFPYEDYPVWYQPTDDEQMRTLEVPRVISGRLADPTRPDEAVVTTRFLQHYHRRVGDVLTGQLFSPEQASSVVDPGRPAGPTLPIRIVGEVRSPWFSDELDNPGKLFPTPAVYADHRANFGGDLTALSAIVRLRRGDADLSAFSARLQRLEHGAEVNVREIDAIYRAQRTAARFDATNLAVFGLTAMVAAIVLVGQTIVRHVAQTVQELSVPRALGLDDRSTIRLAATAPLLACLAGSLVGGTISVLASRWFPIGTVALKEPDPGFRVDRLVTGLAPAATVLLALGVSVATAAVAVRWSSLNSLLRPAGPGPTAGRRRVGGTVLLMTRMGLPLSMVIGIGWALGRRSRIGPTRSGLFTAVAGTAVALLALTFAAGAAEAAGNGTRFGQTWALGTAIGYDGKEFVPAPAVEAAMLGTEGVAGVNDVRVAPGVIDGLSVNFYSYAPTGAGDIVLTGGNPPRGASDIVLGTNVRALLKASQGDRRTVHNGPITGEFTITGTGFVLDGIDNSYADGAWVSAAGFDRMFDSYTYRFVMAALRPGADPDVTNRRLSAALAPVIKDSGLTVEANEPPGAALREVQLLARTPLALAGFVGLLAVGALTHTLALAARRQRSDLAVLRALGMTRRQVRSVVRVQALVPMVVGLVIGVPLGVAGGRVVWRVVADLVPVQFAAPVAPWALLLATPVAVALALLLALVPAARVSRLRVADVLRSE